MSGMEKYRILGMLISKTDITGPEPTGPLGVLTWWVEVVHRRVILTLIGELRQVPCNLGTGLIERVEYCIMGYFLHAYPFRPAVATPWTKNFCKERKTMTTGIRATTLAAMMRPYSLEYWLMNILKPICTVLSSILVR